MTPEDAAAWMVDELKRRKYLDQSIVAHYLATRDKALVYQNANGNVAVVKPVYEAFKKAMPDNVVWSRSERHWRFRGPRDRPGRMQD